MGARCRRYDQRTKGRYPCPDHGPGIAAKGVGESRAECSRTKSMRRSGGRKSDFTQELDLESIESFPRSNPARSCQTVKPWRTCSQREPPLEAADEERGCLVEALALPGLSDREAAQIAAQGLDEQDLLRAAGFPGELEDRAADVSASRRGTRHRRTYATGTLRSLLWCSSMASTLHFSRRSSACRVSARPRAIAPLCHIAARRRRSGSALRSWSSSLSSGIAGQRRR